MTQVERSEGVEGDSLTTGVTFWVPDKRNKLYSSQGGKGVGTFPGRGDNKCKHFELGRQETHDPRHREDTQ